MAFNRIWEIGPSIPVDIAFEERGASGHPHMQSPAWARAASPMKVKPWSPSVPVTAWIAERSIRSWPKAKSVIVS